MTLKDTEKKLLTMIECVGMHRTVHHYYDNDRITTVVKLYDEEKWVSTKGKEPPKPLVVGMAECSKKDNFNKCKGRVIATGRALKKYQREKYG